MTRAGGSSRRSRTVPASSRSTNVVRHGRTTALADRIGRWMHEGRGLALLVGGADGLAPACIAAAEHPLVPVPAHAAARTGAGRRRGTALSSMDDPPPPSLPPRVTGRRRRRSPGMRDFVAVLTIRLFRSRLGMVIRTPGNDGLAAVAMIHLASQSPRRRALLDRIGVGLRRSSMPQSTRSGEPASLPGGSPSGWPTRRRRPGSTALASTRESRRCSPPTPWWCSKTGCWGKPRDEAHAMTMLRTLSGRMHHVISTVAIAGGNARDRPPPAASATCRTAARPTVHRQGS